MSQQLYKTNFTAATQQSKLKYDIAQITYRVSRKLSYDNGSQKLNGKEHCVAQISGSRKSNNHKKPNCTKPNAEDACSKTRLLCDMSKTSYIRTRYFYKFLLML